MRDKIIRWLLYITLCIECLIIFFKFIPLETSVWLWGIGLPIINMVLFLIIFFKLLNRRYNYIFSLLLLFIPIYSFCALNIFSSNEKYFVYPMIIACIIISAITIIALISTRRPDKDVCILIDTDLRIIFVFSVLFELLSIVGKLIYSRLYYDSKLFHMLVYLPLFFLGVLMVMFLILVVHATIEYITLKKVKMRLGMEEENEEIE